MKLVSQRGTEMTAVHIRCRRHLFCCLLSSRRSQHSSSADFNFSLSLFFSFSLFFLLLNSICLFVFCQTNNYFFLSFILLLLFLSAVFAAADTPQTENCQCALARETLLRCDIFLPIFFIHTSFKFQQQQLACNSGVTFRNIQV